MVCALAVCLQVVVRSGTTNAYITVISFVHGRPRTSCVLRLSPLGTQVLSYYCTLHPYTDILSRTSETRRRLILARDPVMAILELRQSPRRFAVLIVVEAYRMPDVVERKSPLSQEKTVG